MSDIFQAPFTVHFKVVPNRASGKRFEMIRDLQKLGVLVYQGLSNVTGLTIASPGGGQARMYDISSDMVAGMAVKPQIGDSPAQLMITGFYQVTDANAQPYADAQVVSANAVVSGTYGAHPWDSAANGGIPATEVLTEVKALKALLLAHAQTDLPVGVTISVFRLEYKGIVFGDRGVHFPR